LRSAGYREIYLDVADLLKNYGPSMITGRKAA
jgi:hypothetical protein